jgi:paraquat-inducible protein B
VAEPPRLEDRVPPPDGERAAPYPEPLVAPRSPLRLSLVWLVPIGALIVGLYLVVSSLLRAGPEIVIELRSAEGLQAGRSELRYKEVVVGRVSEVALSEDRESVHVTATLNKSVAELAVEDTRFWVVRPRIGTAGVSGLDTLLSGAYIGVDAGVSKKARRRFVGLDTPPFPLHGEPGRSFVLSAEDLGSLEVGSPVYYRRTRVGRVVDYKLDAGRDRVDVQVFIESPNEVLVSGRSRFWNASGIDLAFDAGGLTVNAQTIASVVAGGVAFASPEGAPSGTPAGEGARFELFATRKEALSPPDGEPMRVRMEFNQSLRGLVVGAPVDLLGVELGTVRSVVLQHNERTGRFALEVIAEIYPLRLGNVRRAFDAPPGAWASPDHLLLKSLVDAGVRAQVRTGNLLTGQLYVALDFVPRAAPARFDAQAPVPTLPTVPGTLADVQPQLAEIVAKIGKVPFDEIGVNLQATLANANAASMTLTETLGSAREAIEQLSPEAQKALVGVRDTLASAQSTLEALDRNLAQPDAPLQRNANEALAELRRAARALRVLADYLQQHPESLLRGNRAAPPPGPEGTR